MVLNYLLDTCIHTCPQYILTLHYQRVENGERVGHTFILWYIICEHNTN